MTIIVVSPDPLMIVEEEVAKEEDSNSEYDDNAKVTIISTTVMYKTNWIICKREKLFSRESEGIKLIIRRVAERRHAPLYAAGDLRWIGVLMVDWITFGGLVIVKLHSTSGNKIQVVAGWMSRVVKTRWETTLILSIFNPSPP